MLDRKFIVENAELVKENCRNRNVTADVARLVELEHERRAKGQEVQELNRRANEVSKSVGQAKDPAERAARLEEGRKLREAKDAAKNQEDRLEAEIISIQINIPNITHPQAPIGVDDSANRELK